MTETPTPTTLHLPRLLCLHGGGTNAHIFRLQCRMLEKRLDQAIRLVYADAPITGVQPGPDVTSVFKDHGPFRSWLPLTQAGDWPAIKMAAAIDASLLQAVEEDDSIGATGEWVGLLGFSQGAKVAASILYRQQSRGGLSGLGYSFRFAVLFAGRGPLVWLLPELPVPPGLVDAATPSTHPDPVKPPQNSSEHILRLPTIHVHGLRDPGLDRHRELLNEYCHPIHAKIVEWDGNHRMPIKSPDVEKVVQEILAAACGQKHDFHSWQ